MRESIQIFIKKTNSAISGLMRTVLYNRYLLFVIAPLLMLTGATRGKPKDLTRPCPTACPACCSNNFIFFSTVPYYKTHLVHWGSSLSVYNDIIDPVYKLAKFDLHRCRNCGLVFVPASYKGLVENVENHPLFFDKVVEPYLSQTQPLISTAMVSNIISSPLENIGSVDGKFKLLYTILANYREEISTYLDFGANMGAFAEFIRIAMPDIDVSCCEINQYYVIKCRERYPQLRVIDKPLTSKSVSEIFDCIYCSDVIEHIWDLDEIFLVLKNHIRENGLLMLVTPNSDSPSAKKQGVWWWSYIVPHHVQFFNLSALTALFTRFGFQLVETGEIGDELYVVCRKTASDLNSANRV